MSFTKQQIPAKTLCIIDIGSYKLRLCAARFKNKEIEMLGYYEKRQDISYFANQECLNLPGLCDNISEAIKKLEEETEVSLNQIVINYPFGELFLSSKQINFKRKFPHTDIKQEELTEIIQSVEKRCLNKLSQEVDRLYGLTSGEIQILLSRVNYISIDGNMQDKIIGTQGENMKISLLNAFVPMSKHNLLAQIGNAIDKKIFRILPTEYCITKIFPQKNIIIINIGATQTTLSYKKSGNVEHISKIPIGINDLVNKIAKNSDHTRAEIIENISGNNYKKEKEIFLSVWEESIGISLQDMLGKNICPRYFYIGGGGSKNNFIKQRIQHFPFAKYNIRIVNNIQLIQEDMSKILTSLKNIKLEDIQRIPLDVYVLLLETNLLISREKDIVSSTLKTVIEQLGYIKT